MYKPDQDQRPAPRRTRREVHTYSFQQRSKRPAWARYALIAVCVIVLIWSVGSLISYFADAHRSDQTQQELSGLYHSAEPAPSETPIPTDPATPQPAAAALPETSVPVVTESAPVVTRAPANTYDPFGGYPNNPYREENARFKSLRQKNRDIIGWLNISNVLDTAVVLRNNTYYLTRGYDGKKNVNGAIFLDESIKLNNRPKAYILYGHNMKTEAMFGMLHKYENKSYLCDHSVITFDTIYEDGQYAVFSICEVMLNTADPRFVDFYNLPFCGDSDRQRIITRLQALSKFRIGLDVTTDDQLLILVTCTGDDTTRRLVAARRLRDGESAERLSMIYLTAEPTR